MPTVLRVGSYRFYFYSHKPNEPSHISVDRDRRAFTALLMQAFYQQIQHDPDKVQALRQAMLQTLKSYRTPKDWVVFVLMGEAK